MSKVGVKLLKEEIVITRFANSVDALSVEKYTSHPGPWLCFQLGLLAA